jgi:acyl-CoA reductase-like NAD-dependent aldehyde dehydrogenase
VKAGPRARRRHCVVLKPAEQTPASIMVLIELVDSL